MNTLVKSTVVGLLVVLFCGVATAQIYKWRDKDGNLVMSSTPPPPGVKWEKRKLEEVRETAKPAETTTAKPAPRTSAEKRPVSDVKVIMYMTDWCPVCKRAREYLNGLGVNLVEYNVDTDRQKEQEWIRKVGNKRGVPTLDIEGIIIQGLYGAKIQEAIEEKRAL